MILLNGTLLESGAPDLSLLNRSFKYGDGLFESTRIVNGKPILLADHFDRLYRGMKALAIDVPEGFEQTLTEAIATIIEANGISEFGRLRLHVYRSGEGAYLPTDHFPQYLIEAYSLKDNPGNNASVSLCDYREWPLSPNPLTGFKTANSLPYVMAASHARRQGFDDAVLFSNGKVSETSSANLFIIKNKKVLTPPLNKSCCLDGVMRKQIFKLGEHLKITIKESNLSAKDLLQADEMFLTNSVRGIIPVGQYLSRNFPEGYTPLTALLKNSLETMLKNFN